MKMKLVPLLVIGSALFFISCNTANDGALEKKLNEVSDSQLRTGGFVFAIIGFVIIWYLKG